MQTTDPEPKRTVAYYLPADLIDWIRALALAHGTNASYETARLLRLARRIEEIRATEVMEHSA